MGFPKIANAPDVDEAVALAAQFIPAGARVLELDAASLSAHLPFGCIYRCARRDALSAEAAAKYDIVVMLGAMQSQAQAESFFSQFIRTESPLLICHRNNTRLGFHDLIRVITRNGFRVEASADFSEQGLVMRLGPARKPSLLTPCSVAVLSGNMTFAERLGMQMVASLLPGEADLHCVNLGELESARDRYDLVILGAGQGLFHPLYSGAVIEVIARARAAIGIFGTIQRELLPRAAFDRLLDSLDIWFARSRDDVLLYGRGRDNVIYLGDGLMGQFPMGHGSDPELLTVNDDALRDLPLDRSIAAIQRHRAVFAHSVTPLLCALNSADTVAYADDPAAGEFRSLLTDIFGRAFPANEFFQVDRDAVMRYRARVHRSVANMRRQIDRLLHRNSKAAA